MSIQYRYIGDRDKALSLVPFAVNNLLEHVKWYMKYGELTLYDRSWNFAGDIAIRIQANLIGIEPIYTVSIAVPLIPLVGVMEKEKDVFLLYLVTVAKPFPTENSCVNDELGKSIYKPYIYKILNNGSIILPSKGPKIIDNIGRTLTCQQDGENLYCDLSFFNLHSHDIGGIVPGLTGDCDYSTYWGYPKYTSIYCPTIILPYWGSDRAELTKGGRLIAPAEGNGVYISGRHNLSLDENGNRDGYNLRYDKVTTEYSTGCLWLPDRIDAQGLYRLLAGHAITYFDNNGQYVLGRNNIILKDIYDDKHNWIYYVPIMTIAKDQFLYRSHEKVGNNAEYGSQSGYYGSYQDWSCYEADLTEKLVVGDTVIDTFTGSVTNTIEGMVLSGADTVTRPTTSLYIYDGCPGTSWSVSGGGGDVSINQSGVVTVGSSACGTFTVTASCPMCGTSDSMDVLITNAGQWKPYPYGDPLALSTCMTYHFWANHQTAGLEKTCETTIIDGLRHQVAWARHTWGVGNPSCHCGQYEWMGSPSIPGSYCGGNPISTRGNCYPYSPCGDPCVTEWRKYVGQTCEWLCSWSGGGCGLGFC